MASVCFGMHVLGGVGTAAAAEASAPHGADLELRTPRSEEWDVTGEVRLRGVGMSDFGLDPLGTTSGRTKWLESRVVVGGRYRPARFVDLVAELEALNGQVVGDETRVGLVRGEDTFDVRRDRAFGGSIVLPRQLYADFDVKVGRLRVGQQTFDWGLGLLANSGVGDSDFGDRVRGNLVERVLFATRPFARSRPSGDALGELTVFAAADLVFRDENASLLDGDRAGAAVVGARLGNERFQAGLLALGRLQRDRVDPADGRSPETRVFVTDATGKVVVTDPKAPLRLSFEAEGALIAGRTTRPYLEESASNGAAVLSYGWAARMRLDDDRRKLTAKVELGQASGDDDTRDDVARQFAFHSDYNVGLVLFDHVLPMLTARAVDRVNDPALLAVPPSSTRFLVAQGGVTNATYLNPTLRYRPNKLVDLRLGYLYAASTADLVDPYATAKNGGYHAPFGVRRVPSRVLGHEVDASVRLRFALGAGVFLRVGAEGGAFFPGAGLDGLGGRRTVGIGRLLTDVSF